MDASEYVSKEGRARRDVLLERRQQVADQHHELGAVALDSILRLFLIAELEASRIDLWPIESNRTESNHSPRD